ncbi:diacylglycerol kinase kappa-like [Macrobrachium rosenbergii]|uniref:diacylglycerol kinase kappa-like n=1 Tax=Macrobrachium rosenbergii TaxID=79674 RepID=UPI0034D48858
MNNSQEPPEYSVQWPSPSMQISNPSPVPGPAPVPVPRHPIDLPPGDSKIDSQSLPVPLECTEQYQAPSVLNGEQSPNPIPVPDPALVPVPEHAPDLHSRDPSSDPFSLPVLAMLPVPVREMDSSPFERSQFGSLLFARLGYATSAKPVKNTPAPVIKEANLGDAKLSSSDLVRPVPLAKENHQPKAGPRKKIIGVDGSRSPKERH